MDMSDPDDTGNAGNGGDTGGDAKSADGCGCSSGSSAAPPGLVAATGLLTRRRRQG